MKECSKCLVTKQESEFSLSSYRKKDGSRSLNTWCKACYVKTAAEYQKQNREKTRLWDRRKHYRRKYGITQSEYDRMFNEQNGKCAICIKEETHRTRSGDVSLLAVDHDHHTGQVRALLCFDCNTGLGRFERQPDLLIRAYEYLNKHRTC